MKNFTLVPWIQFNPREVRLNPREVRMDQTTEKEKNHKHGCIDSTIKDRDLKQKPNTSSIGSIFDLNGCYYQKSQKWLP